jgi:hypothetical protein
MKFKITFIFVFLFFVAWEQDCQNHLNIDCDTTKFSYEDYKDSLPFYETFYGKNKDVKIKDNKLKLAFYVALRHFPELWESSLKMKLKNISTTMQAQPKWTFIFRNKERRGYQILVNQDRSSNGMFYKDLSFNSLVGWIGHEFAHVLDYSRKDNLEMIGFIADYITSRERMRKVERKADKETIHHGLGIQLLDGVTFFQKNKHISKEYRDRKKKYYLSQEEIIAEIKLNCD